ncbi:MAG: phospholipid carrier-dependent glycosyltransferase, partial [Nitrospira sp.]|nr:phospholipid carrier-dependent glycosyltransferase [Nitrospira sp.]
MEQFPERKHLWLWAAFVLCLLFIPSLFSRGPWHVDDLRYAEVARQMGEYGNYLVPHINGRVYGEKPPGFFWFVVGIQKLTGVSYLAAARLLAALSTVATCGILVALGRLLFRRVEIGLIGAMVFATFIFVIDRGQRSLIDPFLVPLTTGAVLGLLYAAVAPETKKRMLGGAAACLLMALACMTKGPVGLIIPLLGALALGITWRGRQGVSIKWLVAGVVFGGAVTLLWLWLASQDVGQ